MNDKIDAINTFLKEKVVPITVEEVSAVINAVEGLKEKEEKKTKKK